MSELTTGDDARIPATVVKNKNNVPIDLLSVVKASITTLDKQTILIPAVIQSNTAVGADWPNGLVVVEFDSTATDAIPDANIGQNSLEVQVDDPTFGKQTYSKAITIKKGTIDQ